MLSALCAMLPYSINHHAFTATTQRLPPWFRIRISASERLTDVRNLIRDHKLHTVCRSAACPNRTECWNSGTAAFMILGNVCTRGCRFCNVPKGTPPGLDHDEPNRVSPMLSQRSN